ncbi:MAG: hypothetical protein HPY54_09015 [Chthonomonadetes bacterium]|nr:hypothetical protein [Chthonomonadetes bacterium]
MKIAVASNNEKTVAYHLGRCKGFVVVEIEDGEVKEKTYRPVPVEEKEAERGAQMRFRHGAGCAHGHEHHHGVEGHGHGHGYLVVATIHDCDAVIARGAGMGMVRNLRNAGKKLYLTEITSVDEAISAYLKGEILPVVAAT